MKTKDLLEQAFLDMQSERAAKEETKLGILRAGNAGLMDDGQFAGACPRLAYLRMLGLEVNGVDEDQNLMLEGGLGNEELWVSALKRKWPGIIKQEEEIPIAWETKNGTKVSGRPDIVLCDEAGTPVRGLELKLICSVWTARTVLKGQPKLSHLTQAAHYSWKIGECYGLPGPLEFELWYTSRVNWALVGWMQKHFPEQGQLNSEFIDYKEERGYMNPFRIQPFRIGFEVSLGERPEDLVKYRQIGTRDWQDSIVSHARIADFYDFVSRMETSKELGARPRALKIGGDKENYSPCDYCPALRDICDTKKEFSEWKEAVVQRLTDKD